MIAREREGPPAASPRPIDRPPSFRSRTAPSRANKLEERSGRQSLPSIKLEIKAARRNPSPSIKRASMSGLSGAAPPPTNANEGCVGPAAEAVSKKRCDAAPLQIASPPRRHLLPSSQTPLPSLAVPRRSGGQGGRLQGLPEPVGRWLPQWSRRHAVRAMPCHAKRDTSRTTTATAAALAAAFTSVHAHRPPPAARRPPPAARRRRAHLAHCPTLLLSLSLSRRAPRARARRWTPRWRSLATGCA